MPPLLDTLRTLAAREPLREKIVVAPSLAVGHQILDALAMSGTPWVNLRIETVRTIADAVAAFDLAQSGVTVLSRAQALTLIERACDRVLDSSSYFAALASRPGLHRAIQRSLDDLRHAGFTADAIPVDAFEDARKAADLKAILQAYEEELREGKYADRFGVLARAVELLREGARPWPRDARWVIVDDSELTREEGGLVSLASATGIRVKVDEPQPRTAPAARFDFRRAIGAENEVRGAFRAITGAKTPFDDAELVYTARDPYLPLAFELASEYGIPCTFAEGIAGHYTRPGRAAIAFLEWIGDGWHATGLQKVARAGSIDTGGEVSAAGFARALRQSAVGWGRERYLPRLDAFIEERTLACDSEENEGRRSRIDRSIREAKGTRAVIARLLDMTKTVAGDDEIDAAAAARAAAEFVRAFSAVTSDPDSMAREAVVRVLGELADVGAGRPPMPRDEATARLADAVRAVHVAASNPRPGHLHVTPLHAAGWNSRSRLFVAGLDEEHHPGSGLQDPVVLDAERDRINAGVDPRRLQLVGDLPARKREQFRRLLSRSAATEVTLSYSSLRLRDGREHFPSHTLVETFRDARGKPAANQEDIAAEIARDGFVDPVPLSAGEWWLLRRFMDGDTSIAASITSVYPLLASGAAATDARNSDAITPWDGKIAVSSAELDPRLNGRDYSSSQLQSMATCPYRHFLERLLHVRPVDEREYDPDRWLQATEYGTLLHEVFERTMRELCAAHEKPSIAYLGRMQEIAEEEIEEWRALVPPPNPGAVERERAGILRSCEIFLRNEEIACSEVTPKYFEVSFGFGESEGLAMPGPLELDLGGGRKLRLRGRIDRVDHDERRDEWHVWDYKSGSPKPYEEVGPLEAGRRIQPAIYARAVEAMLARKGMSGRVTRTGYFFATPRGRGARIERVCSDAELRKALNLLSDVVANGWFPHAGEEACRFCDFALACGDAKLAAKQTERKLEANPDDPSGAAWLELQEVE